MPMTDADKLARSLAMAGIDDSAGVDAMRLERVYLPAAMDVILGARNPFSADPTAEEWESRYDLLQCEIAADMWNRRGAEGEVSHSENGVSRTWSSGGVSKHLMQRIIPKGKAPA